MKSLAADQMQSVKMVQESCWMAGVNQEQAGRYHMTRCPSLFVVISRMYFYITHDGMPHHQQKTSSFTIFQMTLVKT